MGLSNIFILNLYKKLVSVSPTKYTATNKIKRQNVLNKCSFLVVSTYKKIIDNLLNSFQLNRV